MNERIKKHMDYLFASAPKTRKAMDLKEEMTQNTIEKYNDLLHEGYDPEDAFQNVISSIGDVTELFEDLEEKNLLTLPEPDRRKKALMTAAAVGFYIFAGVIFFTGGMIQEYASWIFPGPHPDFSMIGLILAGIICILPTCMLVYAANMYPDYKKKEESLVENYKKARHLSNKDKAIQSSISVIIWTVTLVLYFLISFTSMAWYVTWVIFLIGACVQAVARLMFSVKHGE